MKKVMFVLAVAGMIGFCSCKSNQPAEEVVATEEVVTEEAPVCEDAAAEAPAENVEATPAQ